MPKAMLFRVSLSGETVELLDFEGAFLVLELGSITCPLFQGRRPAMTELVAQYPEAHFRVLYIREAHPGGHYGAHGNAEDKQARAQALRADYDEGREIVVDDFAGTAHRAYGSFPNAVFIINRNGCVVYKSSWNNAKATGRALENLMNGRAAAGEALFFPVRPDVSFRILRKAGKGALPDFLRSLPHLIRVNFIRRNLLLLLGKAPDVLPDTRC
ncbi:MAG: hypothetical protein Q9M48_14810 [Rhodobacterales bacterium]|nr:hypothetical protein [Rhodobacterales bacterium]